MKKNTTLTQITSTNNNVTVLTKAEMTKENAGIAGYNPFPGNKAETLSFKASFKYIKENLVTLR